MPKWRNKYMFLNKKYVFGIAFALSLVTFQSNNK